MGPVDRVAGLKGDDRSPSPLGEQLASFPRGETVFRKILRTGALNDRYLAAQQDITPGVNAGDTGMRLIFRAIHKACFPSLVDRVYILDIEQSHDASSPIFESDGVTASNATGFSLGNRQGNRKGPRQAIGQVQIGDNGFVIGLI